MNTVESTPEHSAMIRAVFPSIALVERASLKEEQSRQSEQLPGSRTASTDPGNRKLVRRLRQGVLDSEFLATLRLCGRLVEVEWELSTRQSAFTESAGGPQSHRCSCGEFGAATSTFRREAESAASLHHSNIVPVYGIGEDQGLQYYAMQ